MRLQQTMEKTVDNAGWAGFATVFGLLTANHWMAQLGSSVVTLTITLVIAHFVKRYLQRRWPIKLNGRVED
jgi:hypothetical protein